jgi:hypothetical protein
MAPLSETQSRFIALHRHWVTAGSIDHHLRRSLSRKESFPSGVPKPVAEGAIATSGFAALSVWYSLLYVVIEGYLEIGYHDAEVDALLSNEDYVSLLRRFRNATFHYQEDPLSPKLLEFLEAENSSEWIHNLNRGLGKFFTSEVMRFPGLKPLVEPFLQHKSC